MDAKVQAETTPWRRWVGTGVWVLAWALLLGGGVCALLAARSPAELDFEIHPEFFLPDALLAAVYAPVAALVLRRSSHPAGWIFAVVALSFAVSGFGTQYSVLGASLPDLPA
ncbi:MAG: hypothetical protein L0L69_02115, partial [Propionibacterium sp.]|nr:hypothetical protein [Propionibacterium sp.]